MQPYGQAQKVIHKSQRQKFNTKSLACFHIGQIQGEKYTSTPINR